MMKTRTFIYLFIAGTVLIILSSLAAPKEKFYYSFDKKVPLFEKHNTILIKYKAKIKKGEAEKFFKKSYPNLNIKWHTSMLVEIDCRSEKIKEELKMKLKSKNEIKSFSPFYVTKDNVDKGITDEILVRFLPNVKEREKNELHEKFGTKVLKTTKIYQKLVVPKGTDVLETANRYYETGLFEFAYPCFVTNFEPFQIYPNDTYFGNQITCHNTGQTFTDGHSGTNDADIDAPDVWDITTGNNDIVIAVLDQGVTSNHPDLPNLRQVRLPGSDFVSIDNDPTPIGDENHGNACAGVIAATMNNNQGIAGVAPNCRIMPIRMLGAGIGPDDIADAIEFAVDNGADILSNSWGNGSSNPNDEPSIVTAIDYAINNNRVVIIAAGNNADHHNSNNGFVAFPANVNIPGVITVGASDRNDNQANYSPTSSLLDIVAPSNRSMPWQNIAGETYEMWSIDIPDSAGYNIWHGPLTPPALGEVLPSTGTNHLSYTARFGGTSHSCPVVAGVAALMLSVNPDLTNREVFDILMNTAEDVGGYTYTDSRCDEMGHGRVNAYCAVQNALAPLASVSGADVLCTSGGSFSVTSLPPGTTINWNSSGNIDRTSPQGSNPCNFAASGSGDGWIDASIVTNCGNEAIVIRKSVRVGEPVKDDFHFVMLNISTGEYVSNFTNNDGNPVELCPNTVYELWTDYYGPFTIQDLDWLLPPDWEIQAQYGSNNRFTTYLEVNDNVNTALFLTVKTEECGWGNMLPGFYFTEDYSCGSYYLTFSPNPTTGETTLTIESGTESETLKSASVGEDTFDYNAEWDMEIYSPMQALKTKKPG